MWLQRRSRVLILTLLAPLVAVACVSLGVAVAKERQPAPTNSGPIDRVAYKVPLRIADIPLTNQFGRETDLAKFHGRIVVLADFMTSCQEECPITTAALVDVRRLLIKEHLLAKVAIIQVSVDAQRDVPSRLLAYSRRFGVPFSLLTGTAANLRELWKYFGVYYKRVKEGKPPDINWQTGKPYTFDIVHTDDLFVLGDSGGGLAISQANANVGGKISSALASLLDGEGRSDLVHPGSGSWSPADLLATLREIIAT